MKRAQRYFGLRPRRPASALESHYQKPGISWDEYVKAKKEYDEANAMLVPFVNFEKPAPFAFDENVVFICIDVEAFEHAHNQITEIGISTLDTMDLHDVPPGKAGINWMPMIRARHFRIKEYAHKVNSSFVIGCPDRFEKEFGESEFISIKDAPQVVASCFRHPFSALGSATPFDSAIESNVEKRRTVLVGHNTKSDIMFLRDIGYDVVRVPNLLEALDTSELYRALKFDDRNVPSLGSILIELGLTGWNLHNAVCLTFFMTYFF